ncbi:hypothetical protein [Formosa sp. A9]|uniref:hypothetical protein n=1 Tax=Formosa sp. A9 TaxID=3442641 RepID=UPI003EC10BDF
MQVLKYLIVICSLIVFNSCNTSPKIHPADLNGYWEIEHVILPDGTEHIYKVNQTVDFFKLNDSLKGYRQKMKPKENSNYIPVTDKEHIAIVKTNDSVYLHTKTAFSSWKETILELNKNRLKVINHNNNVYVYKRYIPLNL